MKNNFWICNYCNQSIIRGSLPKRSVGNALKVYECNLPRLSEVENILLAPRINFIKMIKLPVSRMPGIIDRIINVPIKTSTINENVRSLPRTLDEAQVIPVSLKKKQKSLLSSQYKQQICPAVL